MHGNLPRRLTDAHLATCETREVSEAGPAFVLARVHKVAAFSSPRSGRARPVGGRAAAQGRYGAGGVCVMSIVVCSLTVLPLVPELSVPVNVWLAISA